MLAERKASVAVLEVTTEELSWKWNRRKTGNGRGGGTPWALRPGASAPSSQEFPFNGEEKGANYRTATQNRSLSAESATAGVPARAAGAPLALLGEAASAVPLLGARLLFPYSVPVCCSLTPRPSAVHQLCAREKRGPRARSTSRPGRPRGRLTRHPPRGEDSTWPRRPHQFPPLEQAGAS